MMFLEGIRVLDLSRVLAGPMATQSLADMGADVLKIEPPSGDDTRAWGPPYQGDMAAYYMSCNRNKSSLVLDLKQEQDQQRLKALLAAAHVYVDNYPPQTKDRLGLGSRRLAEINPSLVTMNITGYRGQRRDDPGYDIMIQAESGMMGITGPAEQSGYKMGVAVVDVLTGLMAANGILAALMRATRTGRGAHLSISLYQTALMSLVNVATNYLVDRKPSQRWGNAHANIVPYQDFQLADRAVIIGCGNDRQFARLCKLLAIDDPAITGLDNAGRIRERERVIGTMAACLAERRSGEVLDQLRRERIPCAPILTPSEALAQVSKWDDNALLALPHETLGTINLVNTPLEGDGMRLHHQPPPQLDEGGRNTEARWLE